MGNSHPSHALPNSSPGGGGGASQLGVGGEDDEDGAAGDMDGEKSVLQAKLTNLAIQIGYGGMAVSLVTVLILSIRFSIDEFFVEVSRIIYFKQRYFISTRPVPVSLCQQVLCF